MNIFKFLSILGLAVVLSNCASTSAAKQFNIPADKGVVYLYRPGRAVGAAVSSQIKVNGLNAGGTGPGTFFRWELKPGKYVFSASSTESSAAAELDVKSGKQYFLMQSEHIGINSGRVSIKEVDETTGMKAVKGSKLLTSSYVPE